MSFPCQRGHLFLLRGDVSRIACDVWLLPVDDKLQSPFLSNSASSVAIPDWTKTNTVVPTQHTKCNPWRMMLIPSETKSVEWYLNGVTGFLRSVREWLNERRETANKA